MEVTPNGTGVRSKLNAHLKLNPTCSNALGLMCVVSGGQTGADRAALDVAIAVGLPHGGWCPKGRLAEDGVIPEKYQLAETNSTDYSVRTAKNVIDSDGTLVLFRQRLQGGTALTNRLAKERGKPVLRINLDHDVKIASIQNWIIENRIRILNVAGPRASSDIKIYHLTYNLLRRIIESPRLPLDLDTSSAASVEHQDAPVG